MQSLILITLVAASYALPQGFIADTPEVVAEKARFFQLYNAAAQAAAAAPDIHIYSSQPKAAHQSHHQSTTFNHHHAVPQTVFRSSAPTFNKWRGPVAATVPAGLPGSGTVRNTPEVDAAIAEFNQAYSAALASTGTAPGPRVGNTFHHTNPSNFAHQHRQAPVHHSQSFFQHHQAPVQHHQASVQHQQVAAPRWTGPLASQVPAGVVGSTGQVADTAEVQAARAAFVQTYNSQLRSVLG